MTPLKKELTRNMKVYTFRQFHTDVSDESLDRILAEIHSPIQELIGNEVTAFIFNQSWEAV